MCLDPARLNQALIRLIHRGPTVNDIFPKLIHAKYLTVINASSCYHILKCNKVLSSLTTLLCQFCRYKQLSFGTVSIGNMFQKKIYEIFKQL